MMRPWARWMARHRMVWVLLLINATLHLPLLVGYAMISSIPQAWRDVRDERRDIRRAGEEARAIRQGGAA